MNAKLRMLWTEAYKTAHVAAQITEDIYEGKECDAECVAWMSETVRSLNATVMAISSHTKGEKVETVGSP